MYILAVLFVVSVPFIGLILIALFPGEYYWLTAGASVLMPLFYYGLFMLGVLVAICQFRSVNINISYPISGKNRSEYALLFITFIILIITMVGYGGIDVLLGSITKEDVRQSGFLHAVLTKYLVPSIFAYFSVLRRILLISRNQWWMVFIMTFIVGLSTGGKASALISVLPGFVIIFMGKLSLFRTLTAFVVVFVTLIGTAWLFDSFLDNDLVSIVEYLVRRTFALTAEAPFHVSVAYSKNQHIIDYYYTLLEILGKSVLIYFGVVDEIYKFLFSFSVTAWIYPEHIDAINSGAWNITPNIFVEALIVGGAYLLPLFGWVVIVISYKIWSLVAQQINRGKFARAAVICVYSVLVYLSWLNSAGVMQLIHPLALGSLTLSWIVLLLFTGSAFSHGRHRIQ